MAIVNLIRGGSELGTPLSNEEARAEVARQRREHRLDTISFQMLETLFLRGDSEARWILGFGEKP